MWTLSRWGAPAQEGPGGGGGGRDGTGQGHSREEQPGKRPQAAPGPRTSTPGASGVGGGSSSRNAPSLPFPAPHWAAGEIFLLAHTRPSAHTRSEAQAAQEAGGGTAGWGLPGRRGRTRAQAPLQGRHRVWVPEPAAAAPSRTPGSSPPPLAEPGRRGRLPALPASSQAAPPARAAPARLASRPRAHLTLGSRCRTRRLLLTRRATPRVARWAAGAAEPSRRRPLGGPGPPSGFRHRHFRRGCGRGAHAQGRSEPPPAPGSRGGRWRLRWAGGRPRRLHVLPALSAAGWNRWRTPGWEVRGGDSEVRPGELGSESGGGGVAAPALSPSGSLSALHSDLIRAPGSGGSPGLRTTGSSRCQSRVPLCPGHSRRCPPGPSSGCCAWGPAVVLPGSGSAVRRGAAGGEPGPRARTTACGSGFTCSCTRDPPRCPRLSKGLRGRRCRLHERERGRPRWQAGVGPPGEEREGESLQGDCPAGGATWDWFTQLSASPRVQHSLPGGRLQGQLLRQRRDAASSRTGDGVCGAAGWLLPASVCSPVKWRWVYLPTCGALQRASQRSCVNAPRIRGFRRDGGQDLLVPPSLAPSPWFLGIQLLKGAQDCSCWPDPSVHGWENVGVQGTSD